jgi:hypothetical protein
MISSFLREDLILFKHIHTFKRVSEGAVHFGTFFLESACFMFIETAIPKTAFREIGALN